MKYSMYEIQDIHMIRFNFPPVVRERLILLNINCRL